MHKKQRHTHSVYIYIYIYIYTHTYIYTYGDLGDVLRLARRKLGGSAVSEVKACPRQGL